jgi:formylglycine-generating enzyme
MKMYKLFILIFLFPSVAFGQLCQKYRQEGITAFNGGNYTLALKKFQGAAKVPDAAQCTDLTMWIDKTQKALQPKSVVIKPKDTLIKPKPEPSTLSVSTPFIEPKMVKVESGTFQMGNNTYEYSKPEHSVAVSDFYIGKYEVTQAEWRSVMGKNPPELNFKGCDNCPVDDVSWNDIQEFLTKLNAKTGKKYRLPTEVEWEFAARGGSKSNGYTHSGSDTIGDVAWFIDNSDSKTHPVGQKNANELGIYDMSGNVWEWCQDWYKGYIGSSGVSDSKGSSRVLRSGSWGSSLGECRSTFRYDCSPTFRRSGFGFRLAISSLL